MGRCTSSVITMSDPRTSPAVEWLADQVPSFRYAYLHSAEFHAVIENQLQLWIIQAELMALGVMTQQAERQKQIAALERKPSPMSWDTYERYVEEMKRDR